MFFGRKKELRNFIIVFSNVLVGCTNIVGGEVFSIF